MLNIKEQENLAKKLLNWHLPLDKLTVIDLNEKGLPAVYVCESIMGGRQIIVDQHANALFASSVISQDMLIEQFKNGRTTDFSQKIQNIKNQFAKIENPDPFWDKTCQNIVKR